MGEVMKKIDPFGTVEGESRRAHAAFVDYMLLGPGRSLDKLYEFTNALPDRRKYTYFTMKKWCQKFRWVERGRQFDLRAEQTIAEVYEEERKKIVNRGLGLTHERLSYLYKMADELMQFMNCHERVWIDDAKMVGEDRFDFERFNAALFEQARGVIADIASEVGGRVKRAEVSGPLGGPIRMQALRSNLSALTDEELDMLEKLTEKANGVSTAGDPE